VASLPHIWKNKEAIIMTDIMNPRKDDRLALPALGEYYDDLLDIDAEINGRTKVQQGQSLLCEKIQEKEEEIKEKVKYLAERRGISFNQMWTEILAKRGKQTAFKTNDEEYQSGDEG
jgi:hypothetical protein